MGGEAAHKTPTLRDIAEHLTQRIEDVHAEGGGEGIRAAEVFGGVELDAATGGHEEVSIREGEG